MKKLLQDRSDWFEAKALELGLDFFDIKYEVVPQEVMLEVMSYGLPTRARHWSYGQSYQYQKLNGEMGMSKVYELVLNNDPSYAFLLDTNPDIANTMVIAHVIGHVHFFKNNYLFKQTDRKMVYSAAERAARIEDYVTEYGIERVEHIMNIGMAFERNIDWNKGVIRDPYPRPHSVQVNIPEDEFYDFNGKKGGKKKIKVNDQFPPNKEKDILWFLINYANLEEWEADILQIIREESYYFYPQYMTKIMNEGFATFIHAELMYLMEDDLSAAEYLEFVKIHERVVQPGTNATNINPYYLGFKILKDIKEKWDKKHAAGESDITGFQKILKVVEEEDDISFLRNYLSKEVCEELQLFVYVEKKDRMSLTRNGGYYEVESIKNTDVAESLASDLFNYKAPLIAITKASQAGLELQHLSTEIGTLDRKHLERVMQYLQDIWGGVIDMQTVNEDGSTVHITVDELGF